MWLGLMAVFKIAQSISRSMHLIGPDPKLSELIHG
jgi:hypothetical protein